MTGTVETEFVRPLLTGVCLAPFRCIEVVRAVIPWHAGRLLDGRDEELDEFEGLSAWWRQAESLWAQYASGTMTLKERLDYHRTLSQQFPIAEHRVLYTRSGTRLVAARAEPRDALIDTKLYWGAVGSSAEVDYLCAILNAELMTELVNPMQGKGQFGPRDFYKLPFAFPIPHYLSEDPLHRQLAAVGEESATLAVSVMLPPHVSYQRARRLVREELADAGLTAKANELLQELLLD